MGREQEMTREAVEWQEEGEPTLGLIWMHGAGSAAAAGENTCADSERMRELCKSDPQNVEQGGYAQPVRLLHELRVGAAFNQTTALQHTNAVAADDGAEAVGYDDRCGTFLG